MIVNYNYERYLPEAIDSVLAQTYQNFEIIICDDGSKDNSREVISRYAQRDARIKPIFKENAAVAAALNDTFRASSGEVIAMLDADDMFRAEKLARVVERFRAGGRVGMVMDTLTKVGPRGAEIGKMPQFGKLDRGELRDLILRSGGSFSASPTSAIAFRRACAEKVFPIPEKQFRTEADLYMRTVAALFYAVDVIDEPLTFYRVHSSNVTASTRVDPKWCARTIDAGERMHAVLERVCGEQGWPLAARQESAGFWEMHLVQDYLGSATLAERTRKAIRLQKTAANAKSDRTKTRLKAGLVGAAAMLPKAIGMRVLEQVYLPTRLKRFASQIVRSARSR